jgi:hypothetical protein
VICSGSELTSKTMNPSRQLIGVLGLRDRPIAKPLPTQDSADIQDAAEKLVIIKTTIINTNTVFK